MERANFNLENKKKKINKCQNRAQIRESVEFSRPAERNVLSVTTTPVRIFTSSDRRREKDRRTRTRNVGRPVRRQLFRSLSFALYIYLYTHTQKHTHTSNRAHCQGESYETYFCSPVWEGRFSVQRGVYIYRHVCAYYIYIERERHVPRRRSIFQR